MPIFSYIFGALGVAANFTVYQQKERRKLLLFKILCDSCWLLHYISLGAFSGAGVCTVAVLRDIVFFNENKKWAQGKKWLIFFLCLSIVLTTLTWKNAFSILPAIASALSIFSFWQSNPKITKYISFPASSSMLIYNVSWLSIPGIINESFVLLSSAISLIRMKSENKKMEK